MTLPYYSGISELGGQGSCLGAWYSIHYPWCPNCHADFRTFDPEMNLVPHYTGDCVKMPSWQETGIERHWREAEQGVAR